MKIRLSPSDSMMIDGYEGLNELIPEGFEGEAINYGQGEGQIRIENSEWGFYVGDRPGMGYSVVFEEGTLDFDQAIAMATGILAQIRKKWGPQISAHIEGFLHREIGGFDREPWSFR